MVRIDRAGPYSPSNVRHSEHPCAKAVSTPLGTFESATVAAGFTALRASTPPDWRGWNGMDDVRLGRFFVLKRPTLT